MKKSNWQALILIILSIGTLIVYKRWDSMVADTVSPEIRAEEGTPNVSVYEDRSALLQGVSATDDRDGDVTASLIVERVSLLNSDGEASVQYAAFDSSGNVTKYSRIIRYTDYEGPKFQLAAPLRFAAGSTFEVVDLVRATDILEGDISHRVRATSLSEKALSDAGLYEVMFRVTNSMGDTRELALTVELYPAGSFNSELYLEDYLIHLSRGARFDPERYLDSFRYATGRVDLSDGVPGDFHLNVEGNVDTGKPGVYEVTYTMNHTLGYQTYTGCTRLVVIVEE